MNRLQFPALPGAVPAPGSSVPVSFSDTLGQYGLGQPMPPTMSTNSPTAAVGAPVAGVPTAAGVPAPVPGIPNVDPATAAAADPTGGGILSSLWNKEDGLNMGNLGSLADILGGFGQLYAGFQANGIARDTLDFQKQSYKTNLANQEQTFNLGLEDRIRSRTAQNNGTKAEADRYIDKYKMGK